MSVECHSDFTDPGATAQDGCSGAALVVTTNGPVNPNVLGAYTIRYVSTNASGSSTTNTRSVNVVDTTPPQIILSGSNPMTVECHGVFIDPGAAALDTCAGALNVVTNGSVNPNLPGSYILQYVATDPSGNSATNTRSVNVVDTTPPQVTLNGTNPITIECHGEFTDPGATAMDICAGTLGVVTNGSVNPNLPGVYTIEYVATDASGNLAANTRSVNVVDTTPPVIQYCFTNLTLASSGNCSAVLPDLTDTNHIFAVDNCSSVTITQSPPAGAVLGLGTNQLVLTAFDTSGNDIAVTNTIVVLDATPPVLICPADVLVSADPGQCLATNVALGAPSVTDNCGVAGVTNDAPASFPLGTNLVKWSAMDVHGNSASGVQQVVVYPAPRLAHSITRIVSGADGRITLSFTGAANGTFTVQASSNLLDWVNLHTNTATADGSWTYTDFTAAGIASRFYRSAQP